MNVQIDEMDECHQSMWNEIKETFENLDVGTALRKRSESLKSEITSRIRKNSNLSWTKSSIFHDSKLNDVSAIYRLDGKGICSGLCGHGHITNIVLCLNNRESIGTNFLKLEVSAQQVLQYRQNQELTNRNILGVLVTFNDGLLRAGGWDPAYADSDEYTFAYKHAYKKVIQANLIGMQLHLV